MPGVLFGNKRLDKQLVIAANLSCVLGATTLLPDPPTQLAAEPWRLSLALFPPRLTVGFAQAGQSAAGQPAWVTSCGVWPERDAHRPPEAESTLGSCSCLCEGTSQSVLSLGAGGRRSESI